MNFQVEERTLKLKETSIKFGWVGSSWVRCAVLLLRMWNYELDLQLDIDNELSAIEINVLENNTKSELFH